MAMVVHPLPLVMLAHCFLLQVPCNTLQPKDQPQHLRR